MRALAVALLALAAPGGAAARGAVPAAAAPMPAFTGYVVDDAHVLDAGARARLAGRLARFQRRTRHQMAIVTVAGLGGEDVARFATRLANRWGVGRRGADDGVLLLLAPRERRARIAVGYGLERRLPDAWCQGVMDRAMVPSFRAGRYAEGLARGAEAIAARLGVGLGG